VNEPLTTINTNNLSGYWKFSEGNGTIAYDISGIGNTGTLGNFNWNANSGWVDGKYGSGLKFDGLNDYINIPDNDNLDLTNNFTIMAWVKPTSAQLATANGGTIATKAAYAYYLEMTNDRYIRVYLTGATPAGYHSSNATLAANTWTHIAWTYNSTLSSIYLNGTLDNVTKVTGSVTKTNAPLLIGALGGGYAGGYEFNGTLDEIIIFNRSLNAAEIQEIYSASPHFRGETWNCTINATDSQGMSGNPNSTTRTISNSIPSMGTITIAPSPANTTDTLNCSATGYDMDLDSLTMNFTWYNGSTYYNSSTFSTTNGTLKSLNLTAGIQASNEVWNCTVFVNDGTSDSLLNSTKITISSSAPSIDSIIIKPTTAYTNSTLNCSATYSDADGDKGNITFSWYNGSTLYFQTTQLNKMNNEVVQEPLTWVNATGLVGYWKFSEGNGTQLNDISGWANTLTLTSFNFSGLNGWREGKFGSALQFDGYDTCSRVSDAAGGELNPRVTLTVSAWVNVNTSKSSAYIIAKGWGDAYELVANSNNKITLTIVNKTAGGTDSQSVISNSALVNNVWYHVAGTYNGTTLQVYINGTAENSALYNKSMLQTSQGVAVGCIPHMGNLEYFGNGFNGTVDEAMIFNRSLSASEISEIYSASPHAKGETWNCTINATDMQGTVGAPNSTTITITNIAPSIGAVEITPNAPNTTDTLNCSATGFDLDLDALTMNFTWYNGSTYYNSSTKVTSNGTLASVLLAAGIQALDETWNCTVFVNDGTSNSPLNSTTITIVSAPPTITNIMIKPNPANTTDTLNCSANYNDTDTDKGNVTFSWYNGSTLYWQVTQFNKLSGETVHEPLTWYNKTGLVGYWKFSEGNGTQVRDISGTENNGSIVGNPKWNMSGKYGYGLQFDGKGDYVNVTDSSSLDITGALTLSAWIKLDYTMEAVDIIVDKRGEIWALQGSQQADPTKIQFDIQTEGGQSRIDTTTRFTTKGVWYHIAGTWDGTTMRLYVNGTQENAMNKSGTLATNNNDFVIGGYDPTSGYDFNGTIDEVMIFNRSLTAVEIRELYSNSPQARGDTWNCTINATDMQGVAGNPNSTTITITNLAPSVPEMGGPDNASRTIGNSQTLRCANSTDPDGDTINYVFYGDTTANPTTMLQNSTSTTYTWATTDGQTYYWRCKAEDGVGGVSAFTAQKTFTENTAPTSVDMVTPSDGSTTTNRTPQFNWTLSTDAEGDNITYQVNITCYPSCSADNRLPNSSANQNWTTLTPRLKNFWDDNYYYNWTVRPWDGYEFGTWNTIPYTLKLSSLVSLSMINSSVNFSVLGMGETANTTTNNPVPLSIRNDGNSFVNVNISDNTSLLWTSQPTASEYYRYRIDNVTGREGSFNWTLSTTAWTNVPTSNNTVINYLNYTDATDSAEIEILVTVPPQETAGTKSSRLVFTGFYVREI